jgi:hypothetical protein
MFLCRLNPSRISISIGSPLVIKHGLLENPPFIWVNYNMSLTWIVRPFGNDFPKISQDSSEGGQWGCYNLPGFIHDLIPIKTSKFWVMSQPATFDDTVWVVLPYARARPGGTLENLERNSWRMVEWLAETLTERRIGGLTSIITINHH